MDVVSAGKVKQVMNYVKNIAIPILIDFLLNFTLIGCKLSLSDPCKRPSASSQLAITCLANQCYFVIYCHKNVTRTMYKNAVKKQHKFSKNTQFSSEPPNNVPVQKNNIFNTYTINSDNPVPNYNAQAYYYSIQEVKVANAVKQVPPHIPINAIGINVKILLVNLLLMKTSTGMRIKLNKLNISVILTIE
uniref:Transmembrane domain-containing protein n=1 Tax=Spironucleus salmonicida TaxID=348837 RepID=V6M0S9_9EUKA|eukprot:EST46734.1 Transmembrane domain-containing protein [Spironucleus salmonicida]